MSEIKNLVRCEKGHFYDGDKFAECPHCKNLSPAGKTTGADTDSANNIKTVGLDTQEDVKSSVTVSGFCETTEPWTADMKKNSKKGNTPYDGEKTVGYYFAEIKTEPVVGWLVCIGGATLGVSYQLKSGKNFIGRSEAENDIVIKNDMSVSRVKHAIIVYDPKSKRFLAQPGLSSELFYLNDEVVLQAAPMEARDILQIGETKLMFIPLCGPEFTWEDYIEKEKKDNEK
jgi:hypothetical protein